MYLYIKRFKYNRLINSLIAVGRAPNHEYIMSIKGEHHEQNSRAMAKVD